MKSAAVVMQTVSEGRREMPAFGATLTSAQIRDVAGYVSERLATDPRPR
jgi:mono/diheme cytochrome c family protein